MTDELFAKALQSLKICPSFNNNIYGKLVSLLESQITFDERVTSILFTKVVNYTIVHLNCYNERFYFNTTSNQNKFTIPGIVSYASLIMKSIVVVEFRFPLKLICYMALHQSVAAYIHLLLLSYSIF